MLVQRPNAKTIVLETVETSHFRKWFSGQSEATRAWIDAHRFRAKPGEALLVPAEPAGVARALAGVDETLSSWASLFKRLPRGRYQIDPEPPPEVANRAALGWALASYGFRKYKSEQSKTAELVWPEAADRRTVAALIEGITLARDLINTPANDLGPPELASECEQIASRHGAGCSIFVGNELLEQGYPTVHAVGRAAAKAPHMVDFLWGEEGRPKIALVGKGVCFDTGGLDLKPSSAMQLMKKDMGGAAIALGLAHALMSVGTKVQLRVLIPAVENSVNGDAMRPLDILRTRQGTTVEIGNTDAEGRLILADALTVASEWKADLIIDIATLTGAARVALGTDLPALFTNDDALAAELIDASTAVAEPLWRLPLYEPYRSHIESTVADLNNAGSSRYGGAITAALFLREFVGKGIPWAHIDTMAYNLEDKPGRPKGGEAMSLRALFEALTRRYGVVVVSE